MITPAKRSSVRRRERAEEEAKDQVADAERLDLARETAFARIAARVEGTRLAAERLGLT